MQRRQFDANGKVRNSHGDYPEAVRAVGSVSSTLCATAPGDLVGMPFHETLHGRRPDGSHYPADQCALRCQPVAVRWKSDTVP